MHIESLWAQHMRARGLSPSTIRRRITTLHALGRWVAPSDVLEATEDDITGWLARQHTQWTRYSYYRDTEQFFRWAHRRDLVATNPMTGMVAPRPGESVPRPLSVGQLRYALSMAAGNMRLILLLGAYAGLRINEIAHLHSDDVHLFGEHPVLVVRDGKGRKDRVVPLHRSLIVALAGRRGWVVAKSDGGRYRSTSLSVLVSEFLRGLGIEATAHCLRHCFGTEAAQASNGNLIVVAKLMGHSDPKRSLGYIRLRGEHWDVIDGMWGDAA